jgi:hypothetical protein
VKSRREDHFLRHRARASTLRADVRQLFSSSSGQQLSDGCSSSGTAKEEQNDLMTPLNHRNDWFTKVSAWLLMANFEYELAEWFVDDDSLSGSFFSVFDSFLCLWRLGRVPTIPLLAEPKTENIFGTGESDWDSSHFITFPRRWTYHRALNILSPWILLAAKWVRGRREGSRSSESTEFGSFSSSSLRAENVFGKSLDWAITDCWLDEAQESDEVVSRCLLTEFHP